MAFGAQELRVLQRALALALHPSPASAEDVQDCLRLARSLDEAMGESARLRDFLMADLARYRAALPGSITGYLTLLDEALSAGHRPGADDLAALRALRGNPAAAALLSRCAPPAATATVTVPAARTRLLALPGGRCADQDPAARPGAKPPQKPAPDPAPETPKRPVPTPGELFPRRKPTPPPAGSRHHLAAG
ncbi:hypothetical protein [Streptomyces sp. JHA26]|uniref:hypothetical protein n=1 Tax=Streptomyces sp. JHA26 TaxID=1917143 RepID=UPI0015C52912|nr:hypothetical protein [Streptomyces sp. JHA26]